MIFTPSAPAPPALPVHCRPRSKTGRPSRRPPRGPLPIRCYIHTVLLLSVFCALSIAEKKSYKRTFIAAEEESILFFAGRHGGHGLTGLSSLRCSRRDRLGPSRRFRSARGKAPHPSPLTPCHLPPGGGGEGLEGSSGSRLIWHLQSLRRGAHCEPPASYRPLFCQAGAMPRGVCTHAPLPTRKRRSAELEKFSDLLYSST